MENGASSYRRFCENDDKSALAELIKDYRNGLMLYLNGITGNLSLAEEIAEDTFVLLGVKKPRYREKYSFKTWLYTIGRNLAIDALRKQKRHPTVPIDEIAEPIAEEQDLEEAYLREERKIALHRAMHCLNSDYRQVLWLMYFEELSAKEAAEVMHKSVHAVETLVYRARKALKSQLEMEGFHDENL